MDTDQSAGIGMSPNAEPAPTAIALPLFLPADAPLWQRLLVDEVSQAEKRGNGGKAAVARLLGFKRAYVSRAVATIEGRPSGFPGGVPQTFIDRVLDRLYVIRECPATFQSQPRAECDRIGNGPAPTHNPQSMRIWKECQRCPHRPTKEKE
ncbi:hypothetical protein DLREEDagrD3_28660 [Denitratisoma sp. agr-D3]